LENGFKTSMDSVLLAAACPIQKNEQLLDLGCSVGGAGMCVLKRCPDNHLTGVDIQVAQIELALENAAANNLVERCEFIESNVSDFRQEKAFDHVIMNPPYLNDGEHLRSPHNEKATAMGHDDVSLKEWIDCAHFCLKSKGSMTIIHRADQIDHIIRDMGKRFGAIEIIPLWPKQDVPAKRVIIRAYKDRYSPTTLHAGLILHDGNGDYTIEANHILKEAGGLFL
ncbi:MAG: methyltransferase, partial [Pseudomonadota bacterium]